MPVKLSKETFIEKANKVHNNLYNYFKIDYVSSTKKIIITCKVHGDYEQLPSSHLQGHGCSKCKGDLSKIKIDDFIIRSNKLHNNKYDYSKIKKTIQYKNCYINIICPVHGEFKQTVSQHLSGYGCPKCGIIKGSLSNCKSNEDFIRESNKLHNNLYSYNKTLYVKSKLQVTIICSIHGEFKQTPSDHLSGCGCPSCNKCGYDSGKYGYLYILKIYDNIFKIGITNYPKQRINQINKKNLYNINYYKIFSSNDGKLISNIERKILKEIPCGILTKSQLNDGYTETFNEINLNDVLKIIYEFNLKEEML